VRRTTKHGGKVSDKTRMDIEDAIRAHIADESTNGDMLTGFVVLATSFPSAVIEDGFASYWRVWPKTQPIHISLGLIEQYRSSYYAASSNEEIE